MIWISWNYLSFMYEHMMNIFVSCWGQVLCNYLGRCETRTYFCETNWLCLTLVDVAGGTSSWSQTTTRNWWSWTRGWSRSMRLWKKLRNKAMMIVTQVGGTLIIKEAMVEDSGKYLCMVNNSVGGESVETVLTVTGLWWLSVYVCWSLAVLRISR